MQNGFLVAEIFSRYYKKEIEMHTYSNMHSTEQKKDNWAQLVKVFNKLKIPVPATLIEDTLNARQGAAQIMVETVYTILTGKVYVCFCLDRCGVVGRCCCVRVCLGCLVDAHAPVVAPSVKPPPAPVELASDAVPFFARPTASQLIKDTLHATEATQSPNLAVTRQLVRPNMFCWFSHRRWWP